MTGRARRREAVRTANRSGAKPSLQKARTGIQGFDELTFGGLPRDRSTLVCGAAGSGKTLFGMTFLAKGALQYGEPGAFIAFEETPADLATNFASMGLDIGGLVRRKMLSLDCVRFDPDSIEETGAYDLEGLFLRLGLAIDSVGARRVVIDTLESLFGGISNDALLRSEIGRLFRWLKEKGVTAVVTAERGTGELTRHGLEEYVSDCVILLDHRVVDQVSTRRLRVVKYRGSLHGANEYPFLIDEEGITVVPITSAGLDHQVFEDRVATGVASLDAMLGGKGYFRGSTILVSGTAGTGKTSLAAYFADAVCRRGERCLFLTFEEAPAQVRRNMRSIGLDLERHEDKGLLSFAAYRSTTHGLETHLALVLKAVGDLEPSSVVMDPATAFTNAGDRDDTRLMLVRLIDHLKSRGITFLFTTLTTAGVEGTPVSVSSIVDTWLRLRAPETKGERNRDICVLKSRGMAHSSRVREFLLTARGFEIVEAANGRDGVVAREPEGVLRGRRFPDRGDRMEQKPARTRPIKG